MFTLPRRRAAWHLPGLMLALFALVTAHGALAAPPKVGDKAPGFALNDLTDNKVTLASFLEKGPVVLVMLRGYPGYQCPICTQQVAALLSKSKQFTQAQAQVVLVYPGPADNLKEHADEFVRGKDIPENFHFLLDPDFVFTKQYDLRWDAANETAYPSTFVLDGTGKILYAKVSHSHGGRAKVEDVLKTLEK